MPDDTRRIHAAGWKRHKWRARTINHGQKGGNPGGRDWKGQIDLERPNISNEGPDPLGDPWRRPGGTLRGATQTLRPGTAKKRGKGQKNPKISPPYGLYPSGAKKGPVEKPVGILSENSGRTDM